MKISRQLRKAALNKAGFAPIQMTVAWAGLRLRETTGEVTRPEWWDEDGECVASVKGSYYADINARLAKLKTAVEMAQQAAEHQQVRLSEEEMRQVIRQARDPAKYAAAASAAPSAPTLAGLSVPELFQRWMQEQGAKVDLKTGRARAKTTLTNYNSTLEKLRAFEQARSQALSLPEMDLLRFYQPFRLWLMDELGQSINTFGKHIIRIRSFLAWCEDHDLPVNRKYAKFEAPSLYVGVDALTEDELRAIYALDFQSPDVRRKLYYAYSAQKGSEMDSPEFLQHVAEVELARDKFLECAYSAMHIADADAARRSDITRVPGVEDQVLRIDRGKNMSPCYVPFFDDDVFRLVELTAKYAGKTELLVPPCPTVNKLLKTIQRLAGITRLNLTTKIGRKTFVTIKVMQGTPARLVMMATGHTSETSFNRYLGVDLLKLLEQYRKYQILPTNKAA
jgi:site-specific recombinase XerD